MIEQLSLFNLPTPSMPKLDVSRCDARPINYETAANMVKTYHYAHRVPSIVVSIGMYVDDVLAGCITYGIPPVPNVQRLCGEEHRKHTIELNRLFIHDWAGRNSESWLIGQSFKFLRNMYPQYYILVSYADPDAGHSGRIYRATNWLYTGTSEPGGHEKCCGVELVDGTIMHNKALVNTFGTWALDTIKENLGDKFKRIIPGSLKYRYVYFLGSKKQRKELRQALRWPVLPYPKEADNGRNL